MICLNCGVELVRDGPFEERGQIWCWKCGYAHAAPQPPVFQPRESTVNPECIPTVGEMRTWDPSMLETDTRIYEWIQCAAHEMLEYYRDMCDISPYMVKNMIFHKVNEYRKAHLKQSAGLSEATFTYATRERIMNCTGRIQTIDEVNRSIQW